MKLQLAILAGLAVTGVVCSQAPRTSETVRVEGRVVDSLGKAVPLAQVVAATPRGGIEIARVQADGDGAFVLPRLPRRELVLRCTSARRIGEPLRLELDDSPWSEFAELPVLLQMIDAVTVRGCIKDEQGAPLAGARVIAEGCEEWISWRNPTSPLVETDALGQFELPAPFGHTVICAFAPNHGFAVEQRTLSDDEVLDFVLRSCPSCELRIHYRGATAEDLDWMSFCHEGHADDATPDLWQLWPQTRKDETVTFHGLSVGSGMTKFRLGHVPRRIENTSYAVPATPGAHDIEAPTGPWVDPSAPVVELRGRLVDTDGKPIRAARLTNWVSPTQTDVAHTGDDGEFHLEVSTTLPSIWIGLDGNEYVPVSPRKERHPGDYAFNKFDAPTAGKQELVFVAEKAAAISGRLLDDARHPVWGAVVQIWAGDRDYPSTSSVCTLTDRDGRFALRGLRASSRFAAWLRASSPACEFATERLALRVGETLALGDVVVARPNIVEGELSDGSGPRAGTRLTLCRDDSSRAYERSRQAFTDRLGRFRFPGLPEGRYTLHLGSWPGKVPTGRSSVKRP